MGCLYTAALRLCHQRLLGWLLALGPSVSMIRVPSRFVCFFGGGEKRWGFSLELRKIPIYTKLGKSVLTGDILFVLKVHIFFRQIREEMSQKIGESAQKVL